MAQPIQSNLGENGLDWLCFVAGNFKTHPQLFPYFQDSFLNDFIKNLQTRNACTFSPLNISAVGSVYIAHEQARFIFGKMMMRDKLKYVRRMV